MATPWAHPTGLYTASLVFGRQFAPTSSKRATAIASGAATRLRRAPILVSANAGPSDNAAVAETGRL